MMLVQNSEYVGPVEFGTLSHYLPGFPPKKHGVHQKNLVTW